MKISPNKEKLRKMWVLEASTAYAPLTLIFLLASLYESAFLIAVLLSIGFYLISLVYLDRYILNIEYELSKDSVSVKKGVIIKSVSTIPCYKITNFRLTRGPFERYFGLGTIHVDTAGYGTPAFTQNMYGLEKYSEVQKEFEKITRKIKKA